MSAQNIKMAGAYVELFTKNNMLDRGLTAAENRLRAFSNFANRAGTAAFAAGAGISASLMPSVGAAGRAEAELSKFSFVFRDQADEANKFIEELVKQIGRADVTVRKSMSTFQAFFQGLEFDPATSRKFAEAMTKMNFDFASFFNIPDDQSLGRFISALSGSAEVMDQFGINLKQAALDKQLISRGFPTIQKGATEAMKAIARMDIIMDTMANNNAIDNAKDTMHEYDNQVKLTVSRLTELGETIGKSVIENVLNPLMSDMRESLPLIQKWVEENGEAVATVAKLGAVSLVGGGALLALSQSAYGAELALSGLRTMGAASAATLSFAATPAGALTFALIALTGGIAYAVSQSESFKDILGGIGEEIPHIISEIVLLASEIGDTLGGALEKVSELLDRVGMGFEHLEGFTDTMHDWRENLVDTVTVMNHSLGFISDKELEEKLTSRHARRTSQSAEAEQRRLDRKNGKDVDSMFSVDRIYDNIVKAMKDSIGIVPEEMSGSLGGWLDEFKNALSNADVGATDKTKKARKQIEDNKALEVKTKESQQAIAEAFSGRQFQKDHELSLLNGIKTNTRNNAQLTEDMKDFIEKHGIVLAEG